MFEVPRVFLPMQFVDIGNFEQSEVDSHGILRSLEYLDPFLGLKYTKI